MGRQLRLMRTCRLQGEVLKQGIEIQRAIIDDVRDVFARSPGVKAVFNCTGLGSYILKGVEDKLLYPTRGQVMLVENSKSSMTRMYFRSPQRVNKDTTYIFPRNPGGGVILGGCRVDNDWSGEVNMEFAEDIKRRCCALAPELGRPEDLKVIQHGVGLRRKFKFARFRTGIVDTSRSKPKGRRANRKRSYGRSGGNP
jgi:D-amino-acid oxidase